MGATKTVTSAVPAGVWCPVVSLYKDTPRQEIDIEATQKYFSHLIRGGVNGLVLQGSTAEAALLSPQERIDIIHTARKAAADLDAPDFPLAAGISGQSTNETLRLVDDAARAGADFGLLLPPSYWPKAVGADVILDFYREVADESKIPIIIYNVRRNKTQHSMSSALTTRSSSPASPPGSTWVSMSSRNWLSTPISSG